jgi:hypothetical protein
MKKSCTCLFFLLLACIPNLANAQTADFFSTIGRSMEINANTPKHYVENYLKSVIPFDTLICYSKIVSISKYSPNDTGLIDELRAPFPQKLFNLSISSLGTGKQIFSSDNPNVRWNGKVNNSGEDVPEGMYIATITYSYRGTDKINCVLVELDLKRPQSNANALVSSSVVLESAVEKDEYLGVNISPMTGLFGISYYDKNGTGFFQDGLIFNGFFKSSWLGYDITYYDLQLLELDKSGFYAGLGVALFYTISESTKVESSIMTGFAWSGGYNIHLGPVFLGIGGHFYNFSSSRWTLNFGFKI